MIAPGVRVTISQGLSNRTLFSCQGVVRARILACNLPRSFEPGAGGFVRDWGDLGPFDELLVICQYVPDDSKLRGFEEVVLVALHCRENDTWYDANAIEVNITEVRAAPHLVASMVVVQ